MNLLLLVFGADVKSYGVSSESLRFLDVYITEIQLLIIVLTLIVFGLLLFFLNKTNLGKSIRAVSDNKELAEFHRRPEEYTAYVVEACCACKWHHLVRVLPIGGQRPDRKVG